jgi:uncharacterized membrane protein YcaP (DUF421 family)
MDFAAAVAVGAIVGRTALAGTQSYLTGAVAPVTLLVAHAGVTLARGNRWVAELVDHLVRVLVAHGRLRRRQLLVCGLTEHDLAAQLRQRGVLDLADVRYVLYEAKGGAHRRPRRRADGHPAGARGAGRGRRATGGRRPDGQLCAMTTRPANATR